MRPSRVATLALTSLTVCACMDGGSESSSAGSCGTFRTTLAVKDRMSQSVGVFNSGEAITFELQIANTLNAPATLTAGSSCTAVVFEVFDAATQRRWGNADGIACFAMLQPRVYAALETVVESSTWSQKGSNGAQVPAGAYTVVANVGQYASDAGGQLVDCRAPLSKSAAFTVR